MLDANALLQCDRTSAIRILQLNPWLLIADLRMDLFRAGQQQVFWGDSLQGKMDADFLIAERQPEVTHWQLVCIAAPGARILHEGVPSRDFRDALATIERWTAMPKESFPAFFGGLFEAPGRHSFTCRIVIGDSGRQSADERAAVRSCRTSVLRIRSFRWLLEKQSLYPGLCCRSGDNEAQVHAMRSFWPSVDSSQSPE